jgi:hypothetical protein
MPENSELNSATVLKRSSQFQYKEECCATNTVLDSVLHSLFILNCPFQTLDPVTAFRWNLLNWSGNRQQHKLKNGVFWDVTPCGSCRKWRFGGT